MFSLMALIIFMDMMVHLLLPFTIPAVQGRRVPPWHLRMARSQGPNTCVVEEIPGTNKKFWTECKYWMHREVCGTKTVIRYECCEGFQQVRGKPGCSGVKPMLNLLETMVELGATKFVDYAIQAGLADRLRLPGEAMTVFVPTNQAFKSLNSIQRAALERSLRNPNSSYLLYHMVGKKLLSRDFEADQEIQSLNRGDILRVNRYSNGMMTVNCKPVIRKDHHATNGIVHVIDEVLIPPGKYERLSIPELIIEDGRFRELSSAMVQSEHVNELRRGGPYTIFAPSDESFQKILPNEMARIRRDPKALAALLQNHVVPTIICLPALTDKHKMKTLGGQDITFECNKTGTYVNGAKLTSETMLSSNGVINIISDVLIPDRVRSVLELIEKKKYNLTAFSSLVRSANLHNLLDHPNVTLTVFAPTDEAFEQLSQHELEEYTSTTEKSRHLLNHHIIHGRYTTDIMSDNQIVETYESRSELRLKVYRKAVGVETAIVKKSNIEGQNGVLHIIDRVLTPPKLNIIEMLDNNKEFSMFSEAVRRVRETEPYFLERNGNPYSTFTIFAPTDEAFKELGSRKLESIMGSNKKLKKVIMNHVVDNMMSSGSFSTSKVYYNVRTEYQTVNVHKKKGHLMVNGAHVIKSDMLTKDGIVHCIDQVLMPEDRRRS
ncbi:transforming growth factor-beta-induced protein ig-h3-like [Centruroides vittatus]|uniref:transforming growth factor-beta-induced protein ig-h3-like n=1 Tax=Centruroides vittatus TaxID=120091 RepID=UPI00350FBAD1